MSMVSLIKTRPKDKARLQVVDKPRWAGLKLLGRASKVCEIQSEEVFGITTREA